MKRLKLFIWILVLTIIQTFISIYYTGNGVSPNILYAFTVAYALYEKDLNCVFGVTTIVALIMSTVLDAEFIFIILMSVYSVTMVTLLNSRKNTLREPIQAFLYTLIFGALGESIMYFLSRLTLDVADMIRVLLFAVIINAISAWIIYPILRKTMKRKEQNLIR